MVHKYCPLLAVFLMMMLMTACGPSLRETFAYAQSYYSSVSASAAATVEISPAHIPGGNYVTTTGKVIKGVNIASGVAATVVSNEQEKRLTSIIRPQRIADNVRKNFNISFTSQTQIPVTSGNVAPDVRIMLNILDYGLRAENSGSAMEFFIDTEVRVVNVAETKTVYTDVITIVNPVSAFYGQGGLVGGAVGTAYNLITFFMLGDDAVIKLFDEMSEAAGTEVARELVIRIYG